MYVCEASALTAKDDLGELQERQGFSSGLGVVELEDDTLRNVKRYRGIKGSEGWDDYMVTVEDDGVIRPLEHHVRHSPDGFSHGYGGSGPAELAKDILWDYMGQDPHPRIYQQFKEDFVANWPQDEGWELPEAQITVWILQRPQEDRVFLPHPFSPEEESEFCSYCGAESFWECHYDTEGNL